MVFLFLHPESAFEHLQEELKEKFAEEFNDEGKHEELYLKLTEEALTNEPNYLWMTYGVPLLGYVSMCFDMAYKDPEAPDEHPLLKKEDLEAFDGNKEQDEMN